MPIHLIAAVGGSWTVGPVLGLEDPQPAPAAIAFGRMGLTERVAFAYPRWRGTGTEVELGFVEPAGSAWMFRRAAAVSAPSPVYDNPALVFDSLRGEWMLAFVPQDYTPGAFAQRLTFDGRPIGPGPTVVAVGDGDMDPGPHGGISLAYNARTGRFALAVSHNLVRFEPSGDTIVPVRNGGGPARLDTAPMSTLDLPDPFRVVSPGGPLVALYGRGGVFAVGACHAPQLEFRSGGVQLWYERPQVGISLWSSEPGPGFVTGSEGTLWAEVLSSEEAFLHAYVESPWSPLVAALYVRLNVPEPGRGRVFATLIEDA
ncbi:MAG: hypothetical protein K8H88_16910 [Sandaracinaceae bacterium]|nr:hypothetical protein [Sandaracinaceae bacterium]